jgi:hypothetical protein
MNQINFVCCTCVLDNCDVSAEDLEKMISPYVGPVLMKDIKVTESYYPKQRIVVGPSVEHIKKALFAIHLINDDNKDAA